MEVARCEGTGKGDGMGMAEGRQGPKKNKDPFTFTPHGLESVQ